MDPIVAFLKDDILPEGKSEAKKKTKKHNSILVV